MNTEERFQRIEARLDALESLGRDINAIRRLLETMAPRVDETLSSLRDELVLIGNRMDEGFASVNDNLVSLGAQGEQHHQMLNQILRRQGERPDEPPEH